MKSANIPHDSFSEGFAVGYQLIKGTSAGVPGATSYPGQHAGTTPFLQGVEAGIKAAGGHITRAG